MSPRVVQRVGGGFAAVAVLLLTGGGGAAAPTSGPAVLPDQLAGYSHRTGSVSADPPGRAVALYQHGFGVEFLDFPRAVVVGAGGDVVRRLDLAEDRGGAETQGDPAPMLLSRDGTRVAVGSHDDADGELAVLDLATGDVRSHAVPGARSVVPVAWSADGTTLATLTGPDATNPHSGAQLAGDLGLLDVATGAVRAVPGATSVTTAAFSPDGDELAVQRSIGAGGTLEVRGPDGELRRTLELPVGRQLDGAAAWSPDGALLAVSGPSAAGIAFLDAVDGSVSSDLGPAAAGTPAYDTGTVLMSGRVLGWASATEVVVLGSSGDPSPVDPDEHLLTRVGLDGSAPTTLSSIPTSGGAYGVARVQLADQLLADLSVRPAGDPDRGPWPAGWRVAGVVAGGLGGWLVAAIALSTGRRLRRVPAQPRQAPDVLHTRLRQRPPSRPGVCPPAVVCRGDILRAASRPAGAGRSC